jgi:hypothetical protein
MNRSLKQQITTSIVTTLTVCASIAPAFALPLSPVAPSTRPSNDSRAMCNDTYVGQNTQMNIQQQSNLVAVQQNNILSTTSQNNTSTSFYGSGSTTNVNTGFLGIGASGSNTLWNVGGTSSNNTSNTLYQDTSSRVVVANSNYSNTSSSQAVVGQDCSMVVWGQTQRYISDNQQKGLIIQQILSW